MRNLQLDNLLISRRRFLAGSLCAMGMAKLACAEGSPTPPIVVGAIRWDAWYSPDEPAVFAQRSLATPRYRSRAPLHCKPVGKEGLQCPGSQSAIDAEIRAAALSGLNYWAFVWYATGSSMRVAWEQYQRSSNRNSINWCGIVGLDVLGSDPFGSGAWRVNVQQWADYCIQPNYQKVSGRPLLYLLWNNDHLRWYFGQDVSNVARAVDLLRTSVIQRGGQAPFVVVLAGRDGPVIARSIGADAVSSYIAGFKKKAGETYRSLDVQAQAFWEELASTGVPTVPIAMIGWDTRPRQERPVPWDRRTAVSNPTEYFPISTPGEFASHIRSALGFIDHNSNQINSRLMLIYSWNECDEGGCIMPTLGDPEAKHLDALGQILNPTTRSNNQ